MNVTPVDNENGILLLKQGKILNQINSFNLVCSYNITYLYFTTLNLGLIFASTKTIDTNLISKDLHTSYADQIEHKLNIIYNKLTFFSPHTRTRRGLVNGLGSIVKAITGNLDYEDALRIENQISNMNKNLHDIQTKSFMLAKNTVSEFGKQLNIINENQHKLASMIKNVTNQSNSVLRQLNLLEVHIQIDFSLQIILDKLMILEDAVAFARIGIMHPSIINTHTLIQDMLDIQEKFTLVPVADVNILNIHKIEKSIEVKAYSTEHALNFILDIPSVDPNPYDLIHLYSIPDQHNTTIIPKSKYLVLGSHEYTYIDGACRSITEEVKLCRHLEMKPLQDAEDCITALIEHRADSSLCSFAKIRMKSGKLQNITPSSWLLILTTPEVLKGTCGGDITYTTLTTTQIITISDGCYAHVLNRTLQTRSRTIHIHDVIPLPKQVLEPTNEVQYELQLEDASLDDIQDLINKAEPPPSEANYADWIPVAATPSWTTLLLYAIGAGILGWKTYKYYSKKNHNPTIEAAGSSGGPDGTVRTRFYLKEGEVITS